MIEVLFKKNVVENVFIHFRQQRLLWLTTYQIVVLSPLI